MLRKLRAYSHTSRGLDRKDAKNNHENEHTLTEHTLLGAEPVPAVAQYSKKDQQADKVNHDCQDNHDGRE